jgi:hypothetical protein
MFEKRVVFRSKEYLAWARSQGGPCCLCGAPADELHHFGPRGMGRKGSDLMVARVCNECHRLVQGLGTLSAARTNRVADLISLQSDALELADRYLTQGVVEDADETAPVRW